MRIRSSSEDSHSPPKKPKNKFTEVQISQKWLYTKVKTPTQLLTCPVCFQFINEPIECAKCSRLFCKTDYKASKEINDTCPLCKATPWVVKDTPHIAYRYLFSEIKFKCEHCKGVNFTLQNLEKHLAKQHNMFIKKFMDIHYDYTLHFNDGRVVPLDFFQNLEINYNIKILNMPYTSYFQIFDENEGIVYLDIGNMSFTTNKTHTGTLQKQQSTTIKDGQQYVIWTVKNDLRAVFYMKKYQEHIEKEYQLFLANSALNETHIDVEINGSLVRYRIMFETLRQVNVKTQFRRHIKRECFKFGK